MSLLSYDKLREDVGNVQRTLSIIEQELDLKDESATYIMRMRPYRTMANVISGVVITFSNITEQKRHHEHQQVLMKELQHRTNNLFTVIQAMARPDREKQCDVCQIPSAVRCQKAGTVPFECSAPPGGLEGSFAR